MNILPFMFWALGACVGFLIGETITGAVWGLSITLAISFAIAVAAQ